MTDGRAKNRYSRILPINLNTQEDEPVSPSWPSQRVRRQSEDSCVSPTSPSSFKSANDTNTRSTSSSSTSERILELRGSGKRNWIPPLGQLDNGQSLIVRRIQKNKERRSPQALEDSKMGLTELKQTFAARQHTGVNWEFWASVIGDYDNTAKTQPDKLRRAIQDGFPPELRGLLWQVIATSKSSAMEQLYYSLVKTEEVPCANAIAKDLDRTPMTKQVDREALARLLRAYSLFDPEVGYTQGMAFIGVPLLYELEEAEAFSLFAQLMKTYDFRSMFLTDMPGLHLKLYQFDRLVEDNLETVHTHLKRQGVQSSMYASQWFLTIFAYRFPPELVTRIFDIVIAEGLEALLRFSFALIEVSAKKILHIEGLDELLPFLKEQVFDGHEHELVKLASDVVLLPQTLSKFELEYQELNRLEKERMMQMDTLRSSNARLSLLNKQLEAAYENLNVEHVQIANKMVESGLDLAHLKHENTEFAEKLAALDVEHNSVGELASNLKSAKEEANRYKHENEKLKREIALLRETRDAPEKTALVRELREVKEINERYADQLGSLQEALANALMEHR